MIDFLYDTMISHFGYKVAIVMKNWIMGTSFFIVGFIVAMIIFSYVLSIYRVNRNHGLIEEGIGMVIIKKKKEKIVLFNHPTPPELMRMVFIYFLYKIKVFKNSNITMKDEKRATRIFWIVISFCSILVILSIMLAENTLFDNIERIYFQ